jgi:hypothetical protein
MRAAKVDQNQAQVVSALRAAGARVLSLAKLGEGCPDLLIGYAGLLILMELKNPGTARGRKGLNEAQRLFFAEWADYPLALCDGPESALRCLGVLKSA